MKKILKYNSNTNLVQFNTYMRKHFLYLDEGIVLR